MTNKIHIRYFVGHYQPIYTGAGKSLEKLIHALNKERFEIEILTAYKKGLKRREEKDGYRIIRIGNGFFNDTGYLSAFGKLDFSIAAALYNLTHRNYDLLKFIGVGKVALFSILVAKILGKPIVNKTTAVGDDDPRKLSESFIGRFIIRLFNKNTFHWVISKEIYNHSITYTNWKKEHLFLITNVVKIEFNTFKKLINQRNEYSEKKKKSFLFIGVLDKRKGVDILVKLWNELKYDATLTLCGPLGFDLEVNEQIKNNKDERIKILGELSRSEIQLEYLKADYFIFPSNREGLPNVVLESMSYGLPVIANNMKGVTDFLIGENNERGVLVNQNNVISWKATITEILKEEKDLKDEACMAYNWVVENSSYESVGKQMERMYINLIENEIK